MARSDSFRQYAQDAAQEADPIAEKARAAAQYTQSQPRLPPAYSWGGHPIKPMAARHVAFPYPTKKAVQADPDGGGAAQPVAKQKKFDTHGIFPEKTPLLHPDQAEHERQAEENWGRGSGKDFNHGPVDGIGGSDASGRPVLRPGPKPGGLSGGAAAAPEPTPMEAEPVRVGGISPEWNSRGSPGPSAAAEVLALLRVGY
jgi:hypothetical protein